MKKKITTPQPIKVTPINLEAILGDAPLEEETDTQVVKNRPIDIVTSPKIQQEEVVLDQSQSLSIYATSHNDIEISKAIEDLHDGDKSREHFSHSEEAQLDSKLSLDTENEGEISLDMGDEGDRVENKSASTSSITLPTITESSLESSLSLSSEGYNSERALVLRSMPNFHNSFGLRWPYILPFGRGTLSQLPTTSQLPTIAGSLSTNPSSIPQSLPPLADNAEIDQESGVDMEDIEPALDDDIMEEGDDHDETQISGQQQVLTSNAMVEKPKLKHRINPLLLAGLVIAVPSIFLMDRLFNSGSSS
ncbi:MAG TPA: hypothetical protein VNJ29_03685 [Candidatus Nitrosotenuis sp.]|nr:hypothetical protein [Candidatus Nitrosotenuis sp.]